VSPLDGVATPWIRCSYTERNTDEENDMARTALDTAIATSDRKVIAAEARKVIANLTDGRKLTALDMLKLGHARRTLEQSR
jgi:hypothetical protein